MLTITPYRKHNEANLYNPFRELEDFERSLFAPEALASFRTDIEDDGEFQITDEEKLGIASSRVLRKYKKALEALAK